MTLIGSCSTSQPTTGQASHVANAVTCTSNVVAGNLTNLKHPVFFAKIINRRAYDSNTWVINTGASDHIVCSMKLLTSYIEISRAMVELPNGEATIVTHIGTIHLSSHITLTNVICVPSFTFNLLSINALTKSQPICLVFLSKFCFIQDFTCWSTIGMGQMHDGLYLLQDSSLDQATTSLVDFLSKQSFKSFSATCSSNLSTNMFSL